MNPTEPVSKAAKPDEARAKALDQFEESCERYAITNEHAFLDDVDTETIRAALQPEPSPNGDLAARRLNALRKDVGASFDLGAWEENRNQGWNDCLDYLDSRNLIRTAATQEETSLDKLKAHAAIARDGMGKIKPWEAEGVREVTGSNRSTPAEPVAAVPVAWELQIPGMNKLTYIQPEDEPFRPLYAHPAPDQSDARLKALKKSRECISYMRGEGFVSSAAFVRGNPDRATLATKALDMMDDALTVIDQAIQQHEAQND